jgi:hypothetical protein
MHCTEASCSRRAEAVFELMPSQIVEQCQQAMAHAWMVRTFVKHSDEVEQFPELMQLVRTVFDTARALETRVADPPGYLRMLQKKLGKLRRASEQFAQDAPQASTHTNFVQAVVSMRAAVDSLSRLLEQTKLPPVPATAAAEAAAESDEEEPQSL